MSRPTYEVCTSNCTVVQCLFEVDVSLLNDSSGEALATTHAKVTTDASEDLDEVLFDQPVLVMTADLPLLPKCCVYITPDVQYKITAVSIGPNSMCAGKGSREVACEDGGSSVTFSFTDTGIRGNDRYDVSLMGHIPVICFSIS